MRHSKKTITIQNRTTPYTQTWWAKLALVSLFIVSLIACEDADSLLGFKDDKKRFDVRYIEIPVSSEVVLLDSIRTQNVANEENRILVGSYTDPIFGKVYAEGIAQIFPGNTTTTISATAVLDSAFLFVRSDYYQYGDQATSEEKFTLHEVTQTLKLEGGLYYSKTPTAYDPQPVSQASLVVDPSVFKKEFDDTDTDPAKELKFKLTGAYANKLFSAINKDDPNFTEFSKFREIFKGIAIVPASNKKVVGLTLGTQSAIILYYRDGETKYTFSYFLNGAVNYSRVSYDRSNTDLAGVTKYYTGYKLNNRRGVQSGSGLITKLNFSDFYKHTDTIPNVILNSVQLVINDVEGADAFYSPTLALALTKENNRLFTVRSTTVDNQEVPNTDDVNTVNDFKGLLQRQSSAYVASADNINSVFVMNYNPNDKTYAGFCTLFFQELYYLKKSGKPFENFSLFPIFPANNKSVYRTGFNADNIKLRIYYTRPLTRK